MPLSEFCQTTTKGEIETTQPKMTNCSSDLSLFMPEQDFVELLWENGQIVMQGQSNRPKKSSATTLSSHTGKFQDRDPKIWQSEAMDSTVNDFVPSVSSAPIGFNAQDDDMSPWMNDPIEDCLQNDYCSEFLSEYAGVHLSPHSGHRNDDISSDFGQTVIDSHNVKQQHASKALAGGPEPTRLRTSQLFQLPQQCQSWVPSTKSRAAEFGIAGSTSTHQDPHVNLQDKSSYKPDVEILKPPPPHSVMDLINFSHFSRPAARRRSNLQSVDRLRSNDKASISASSNPMESMVIDSASGFKSLSVIQGQSASVPPKVDLRSSAKLPPEVVSVGQPGTICWEDTYRDKHIITNNNTGPHDATSCQSSSVAASIAQVRLEVETGPEATVASSSICSANSVGAESNDLRHMVKRKHNEGEESGYQSEDVEDETSGLEKLFTARNTNAKRSRATEVHNLSERKRRDRINEKMRTLQKLIPNCNKVDKASMLDEAIEYLKTLKLQLQMMSMGSGLCIPPMMLPVGMHHLYPPPMANLSHMGVNMGMGMGLGYGMGMVDMNGSPGFPLIPVQPMHGLPFARSPMPGAHSLHGMPGSTSLQMYGIPRQELPVSMRRPPTFGSMSGAITTPLPVADTSPSSSKEQERQNIKPETSTRAGD